MRLGKVWTSDDLEPGELPVCQSPFYLRAIGRGLKYVHVVWYFFPAFCAGIFYTTRGVFSISRLWPGDFFIRSRYGGCPVKVEGLSEVSY